MYRVRVIGHDWTRELGLDADPEPHNAEELVIRCASELEALAHFAQFANSLGLPISTVADRPSESSLIDTLHIKNAADLTPTVGPMAQHHGIPTRLLDWTDDSLNAAYFAAGSDDLPAPTSDIAIWALNTRIFARHPDWYVRVFDGDRHANKFLHAQAGRFTQILYPNRFFLEEGRWPDIEAWIVSDRVHPTNPPRPPYTEPVPALRKFVLQASEVDVLRGLLHREGFSRARVMPTLENVAGELSRRWKAYT